MGASILADTPTLLSLQQGLAPSLAAPGERNEALFLALQPLAANLPADFSVRAKAATPESARAIGTLLSTAYEAAIPGARDEMDVRRRAVQTAASDDARDGAFLHHQQGH